MCLKKELKQISENINNFSASLDGLKETINELPQNLNVIKEDPKDSIYLQLHEQYAINNNANLSTVMALVIALIGVIGYYGYMFISTSNTLKETWDVLYDKTSGCYFFNALILVYIASLLILAILFRLCTYQGIAQRKEQFIIHAIRKEQQCKLDNIILPEGYNPYRKRGLEVIQGLYGELVRIFFFIFIVLTLTLGWRFFTVFKETNDSTASPSTIASSCYTIALLITILAIIVAFLYCYSFYTKQYESYIKRQIDYSKNNKDINGDMKKEPPYLDERCLGIENYPCRVCKIQQYEELLNNYCSERLSQSQNHKEKWLAKFKKKIIERLCKPTNA